MSTVENTQSPTGKRRSGLASAFAVAGALVAVAVAALFISAFNGKTTSPTQPSSGAPASYAPLIQYRGTGQPPAAPAVHLTPGAPPTVGLLRAEHSYGAVP